MATGCGGFYLLRTHNSVSHLPWSVERWRRTLLHLCRCACCAACGDCISFLAPHGVVSWPQPGECVGESSCRCPTCHSTALGVCETAVLCYIGYRASSNGGVVVYCCNDFCSTCIHMHLHSHSFMHPCTSQNFQSHCCCYCCCMALHTGVAGASYLFSVFVLVCSSVVRCVTRHLAQPILDCCMCHLSVTASTHVAI